MRHQERFTITSLNDSTIRRDRGQDTREVRRRFTSNFMLIFSSKKLKKETPTITPYLLTGVGQTGKPPKLKIVSLGKFSFFFCWPFFFFALFHSIPSRCYFSRLVRGLLGIIARGRAHEGIICLSSLLLLSRTTFLYYALTVSYGTLNFSVTQLLHLMQKESISIDSRTR